VGFGPQKAMVNFMDCERLPNTSSVSFIGLNGADLLEKISDVVEARYDTFAK
jgi:hypothetical protein